MTGKPTRTPDAPVRYENVEAMPAARPLSAAFKALTDAEVEQRASEDPDAGVIPTGFWTDAVMTDPDAEHGNTLDVDPEIVGWFRSQGAGYRSRMNTVLRRYVEAQKKLG